MLDGTVGVPPPEDVGPEPPPEVVGPPELPEEVLGAGPVLGTEPVLGIEPLPPLVEVPVDTGRAATTAGATWDPPDGGVNGSRAAPLTPPPGGVVLLTAGRASG